MKAQFRDYCLFAMLDGDQKRRRGIGGDRAEKLTPRETRLSATIPSAVRARHNNGAFVEHATLNRPFPARLSDRFSPGSGSGKSTKSTLKPACTRESLGGRVAGWAAGRRQGGDGRTSWNSRPAKIALRKQASATIRRPADPPTNGNQQRPAPVGGSAHPQRRPHV